MAANWPTPIEGGCACGSLRYRLEQAPMFIHCCNCQDCQRETGTAFALNAFIETDKVTPLPPVSAATADAAITQPRHILMPSNSGTGQLVARCPHCYTAVWSYYGGAGPCVRFIRVGTVDKFGKDGKSLDEVLQPDAYIYTRFKMPWVEFPKGRADKMIFEVGYNRDERWPQDAKDRWAKLMPKFDMWRPHKNWRSCEGIHIDVDATGASQNLRLLEEKANALSLNEEEDNK